MAKNNRIKEGGTISNILIYITAAILCFITLYPMYYVFVLSVSDSASVATQSVYFWPKGFQIDTYKMIASRPQMWQAYGNTIFYVVATTVLTILTCVLAGYPLTVKKFIGKRFIVYFLLIPMYFGGGLIPFFLLMTKLNLYNNIAAMIIPNCFNIWYIILTKTYLQSIPDSMFEAAKIDGANHYQLLFRIYMPLAKPILAVIAIYTIVGVWNSWFHAMVFVPDTKLQPLQLYLRRVLVQQTENLATTVTAADAAIMFKKRLSNIQLQYAMIIFTTLPVIFTYPIFQKHFVKGVMLGSLKG